MINPRGRLIAVGGAEDKTLGTAHPTGLYAYNQNFAELGVLRRIVSEAGGIEAGIEVITTASMIPEEVGDAYIAAFTKMGCKSVGVMHIRNREQTFNPDYLKRIAEARCIMFSGGNQMRLSAVFGGTPLLRIIQQRFREERIVVAGTSAGAMAMSNTMIYEGNAEDAHLKGAVKITTGLGFMDDVIFDSHFEKRGRFGRLAQAVAGNPECLGIGLGEDTGMLITGNNTMEAIGSGLVMILDGRNINYTNIADIPEGNPISVENLKVHFCAMGNGFKVAEREFIPQMGKSSNSQGTDIY